MTVQTTDRKYIFDGNGVATSFSFTNFKAPSNAEIQVVHADSAGAETTLVEGTDYSLTLNADQENNPGGTVTYPLSGSPLPSGESLTVIRSTTKLQQVDIINQGAWQPEVIEGALDRLTMAAQDLQEAVDRSVKVDISDPTTTPDQLIQSIRTSESNAASSASQAQTEADRATTEANRAQTEANRSQAEANRSQAEADRATTAADNANQQFAVSLIGQNADGVSWDFRVGSGFIGRNVGIADGSEAIPAQTVTIPGGAGSYRRDVILLDPAKNSSNLPNVEVSQGLNLSQPPVDGDERIDSSHQGRVPIAFIDVPPNSLSNPVIIDRRPILFGMSYPPVGVVRTYNAFTASVAVPSDGGSYIEIPLPNGDTYNSHRNIFNVAAGSSSWVMPNAATLNKTLARVKGAVMVTNAGVAGISGYIELALLRYGSLYSQGLKSFTSVPSSVTNDANRIIAEFDFTFSFLANTGTYSIGVYHRLGDIREFTMLRFELELFD